MTWLPEALHLQLQSSPLNTLNSFHSAPSTIKALVGFKIMDQSQFDDEGFLLDLSIWSEDLAKEIASHIDIELTPAHFEIIHALRHFYQQHEVAPANRPFVKLIKNEFGPEKGNSIYLMTLFPESPAKIAAKIAGLPKPANCL